jgi:hypothetical protein
MHHQSLSLLAGFAGALALSACNLDIPDLNNPGLEQIEDTPTVSSLNTATTGLLVGFRAGKSATVGYVNLLGILGREAYDFDAADVRFVSEVLQSNLNKSSPFGGAFWGGPYANIRQANIILHGVDKVPELTDTQRSGIRGFAHTIMALELLTVILTHTDTGAVIDTDRPIDGPLGPFVSQAEVYAEIGRLLDQAKDELATAGSAFSFPLSPGYTGFNTPATFTGFNRAVRARVAVYTKDYPSALTHLGASFMIDDPAKMGFSLTAGVSHSYSLNTGDATNALINAAIYAHPLLETDAQKQANGMPDARYTAKVQTMLNDNKEVVTASTGADTALKTTLKFKIYTNVTGIPVIRNEELILLKAEALWFTGDKAGALAELNLVRTTSGKLPAITDAPADDNAFVDLLLYERRYSLMYEGGHRWIDLRRFGRTIPIDAPAHVRNLRFPIPQAECDARGGEAACSITSSDPAK